MNAYLRNGLIAGAVLVVIGLITLMFIGIYNSITPWFWIYHLLFLIVLAGVIIVSFYWQYVAGFVGAVIPHLLQNNNWRLVALYIAAIYFTISAILAGFGEPLLISSFREVKQPVVQKMNEEPIKSEINYLLWGKRTIDEKKVSTPTTEYSSWGHWLFAIFLWLSAFIYTPIALREEVRAALTNAIRLVDRRRRAATAAVQTAISQAQTQGSTGHSGFSWMKLFTVEILGEFFSEFIKQISNRLRA